MDRGPALVQGDMVRSFEMTRRIPPPQSPPKQSANVAIGRGSPPPGHDQLRWVVVDSAGNRLHDGDLTFHEAWKLKDQLAGGRKVVSPRIEQAEAVEVQAEAVTVPTRVAPVGVPPGVPSPRREKEAVAGSWAAGITNVDDDDVPEVVAGVIADDELDEMLKDIDRQ